jgi:hypothetical protein
MLMQDELRAVRELVLRKAGCGVFIKLYELFDIAKQPFEALGRKVVFRIEFGPHDWSSSPVGCCGGIAAILPYPTAVTGRRQEAQARPPTALIIKDNPFGSGEAPRRMSRTAGLNSLCATLAGNKKFIKKHA